jgi:eukaryotic-like serine/threonine-protein kinase
VAYGNLTRQNLSEENLKKAFDLKDRASERERLYISAHYYNEAMGDADKTVEIYEEWKKTYPRDSVPRDNLSLLYEGLGQFEKALTNASEAMRLDAKDSYAYQNLASSYARLNRYDEAKTVLDKAEVQNITLSAGLFNRFELGFIQHDEAAMQRAVEGSKGKALEAIILSIKAQGEYFQGKAQNAGQTYRQDVELAQRLGMKEFAAKSIIDQAQFEAEIGNPARARQAVSKALGLATDRSTRSAAAILLARTGDAMGSEKLVADLAREFPNDTGLNSVWLPLARASNELRRNNPAKAIALLEPARAYELGTGPYGYGYYWPNYVRGEAFLTAHEGEKATAEYRKILENRGVDATSPFYSLARLGLGRAYALQGDTTKAKTAYQDFFALWKDADRDVPILKEAKAEYAKLQ